MECILLYYANLQFTITIYLLILHQNEPTWLSLDARIHVKNNVIN